MNVIGEAGESCTVIHVSFYAVVKSRGRTSVVESSTCGRETCSTEGTGRTEDVARHHRAESLANRRGNFVIATGRFSRRNLRCSIAVDG